MIVHDLTPPYYAVIFTNTKQDSTPGYHEMSDKMVELASQQDGFLGFEHAGGQEAITISYWQDLDSIRKWKHHTEHAAAQRMGRESWYADYRVRICKVEREYGFNP
ncbi:MAG: antibiotic biosynthesis monooxygenase [Flavobacteriales bacterium]|nr:antibiotic biosynthesis monooxygenase [Flavobacteriales bacterium]